MRRVRTTAPIRRRYGRLAPLYDWANLEPVLYAEARAHAVELLDLQPGARVLDVACGTGANFALIERRIGPSGRLVGLDLTARMLDRARARAVRAGWHNVELREADVCRLAPGFFAAPFDAALCTLGLSVVPHWLQAWEAMRFSVRPGGRLAIMDAGYPDPSGDAVPARLLAWTLSRLFAADCSRRPLRLLERDTRAATSRRFTRAWVTVAAGTTAEG
jgi:ubiquinone/menaquinone biosynthesis C-methylase UbiE